MFWDFWIVTWKCQLPTKDWKTIQFVWTLTGFMSLIGDLWSLMFLYLVWSYIASWSTHFLETYCDIALYMVWYVLSSFIWCWCHQQGSWCFKNLQRVKVYMLELLHVNIIVLMVLKLLTRYQHEENAIKTFLLIPFSVHPELAFIYLIL